MKHLQTFESFSNEEIIDEGLFRDTPEEKWEKFKKESLKHIIAWTNAGYQEPDWDEIQQEAEEDGYEGRIGTDSKEKKIIYVPGDKAGWQYPIHMFGTGA